MPDRCDCGDKCCANCFPASYRQARAWELDQAVRDRETETEGDIVTLPYTIDRDHRETLEATVLENLNRDDVMKPLKAKLDEMCQTALDSTTDYLCGSYSTILEEVVRDRAARLVKELLKGNHEVGEYFCLEKRVAKWGFDNGKDAAHDPDHIRREIVEAFKAEIQTAEMITLAEENTRLKEELRWARQRV